MHQRCFLEFFDCLGCPVLFGLESSVVLLLLDQHLLLLLVALPLEQTASYHLGVASRLTTQECQVVDRPIEEV